MKRVLVTGGAGFVGVNLTRRLLENGHDVHLLLTHPGTCWRLRELAGQFRPHLADLRDQPAVERVVDEVRPEWIFHLAVYGAYSWQTEVIRIYQTNLLGTVNLVEACRRRGFEAFINTGSSSEYGEQDHPPAETELPEPNSTYAAAKAAATIYCRQTARENGLHLPTLRLYSVYGPYEEPNRLLPALLVAGLEGRCPPLAHAETARDFVYVEDVVDAYLAAAERPAAERGAVYNVGTGQQTTLRGLVELSRSLFPARSVPIWGTMAARSWDTTTWVADDRKIRRELTWQPRYTLATGLEHFLRWLVDRPVLLAHYRTALQARQAA